MASWLVQAFTVSRPSTGGKAGTEPVATTTYRAPTEVVVPSWWVTSTARSPVSRPRPRSSVMPAPESQSAWPESSGFANPSRRSRTFATSIGPASTPGTRCAAASRSTGRSSAFDGMHA